MSARKSAAQPSTSSHTDTTHRARRASTQTEADRTIAPKRPVHRLHVIITNELTLAEPSRHDAPWASPSASGRRPSPTAGRALRRAAGVAAPGDMSGRWACKRSPGPRWCRCRDGSALATAYAATGSSEGVGVVRGSSHRPRVSRSRTLRPRTRSRRSSRLRRCWMRAGVSACGFSWARMIDPITATPRVPPSWRMVWTMPGRLRALVGRYSAERVGVDRGEHQP